MSEDSQEVEVYTNEELDLEIKREDARRKAAWTFYREVERRRTKYIQLESHKYCGLRIAVDAQYYKELARFRWHAHKSKHIFHAIRYVQQKDGKEPISRLLPHDIYELALGRPIPECYFVSTKDGRGLDCRVENLQIDHVKDYNLSIKRLSEESLYKNVWWSERAKKWRTGQQYCNGYRTDDYGQFDTQLDAALAWDAHESSKWRKHFPGVTIRQ